MDFRAYKGLSPKTRLAFGIGLMTWATIGIYGIEHIERFFGMVPSDEEREKLRLRVLRVDKDELNGKN